jgi:hypothetical protein
MQTLFLVLGKLPKSLMCQASIVSFQDRQLREEEQRRKQAEQVTQFRAKEKDAVKQGKKHYYPKKCKHIQLSLFQCE